MQPFQRGSIDAMSHPSDVEAGVGTGDHGSDDEGLDVLLGLLEAEEVPESPPVSPFKEARSEGNGTEQQQMSTLGYCSDEERPKSSQPVSMAVFKSVVGAFLPEVKVVKQNQPARIKVEGGGGAVEKYSGLRIKEQLVSSLELSTKFAELRFLRLPSIKASMMREHIKGAWATIGIVVEKANPKLSSAGKNFVVWKLASLDGTTVSLFLFGEAYNHHWKLPAGSVIAVFNAKTRHEHSNVCLSVFSRPHIFKIGTSMDYSTCKGTRKDGNSCTMVVDRRQGEHCPFHAAEALRKFKSGRVELRGGKMTNPFLQKNKQAPSLFSNPEEPQQQSEKRSSAKYLSSTALKKFLSNPEKVSSTGHSQGKRLLAFLSEMPDDKEEKGVKKGRKLKAGQSRTPLGEKNVNLDATAQPRVATTPKVMDLDLDNSDDVDLHSLRFFGISAGHQ